MERNHKHFVLEKTDLMYMAACWNADPFLIETEGQLNEIWEEIRIYGFHEIEQPSEEYNVACAQLDLDVNVGYHVFESDIFTCKFGGLLESV